MISYKSAITENLAKTLRVLGDTNRLGIVVSIGKKTLSVTEIIKATGLSQTLVSFHLRVLREAQLVTTKRNGPFIRYSLSHPALLDLLLEISRTMHHTGMTDKVKLRPVVQESDK